MPGLQVGTTPGLLEGSGVQRHTGGVAQSPGRPTVTAVLVTMWGSPSQEAFPEGSGAHALRQDSWVLQLFYLPTVNSVSPEESDPAAES